MKLPKEVKSMSTESMIMMIIVIGGYVGGFLFLLNKVFDSQKAKPE